MVRLHSQIRSLRLVEGAFENLDQAAVELIQRVSLKNRTYADLTDVPTRQP
jgi:hypothetical protein